MYSFSSNRSFRRYHSRSFYFLLLSSCSLCSLLSYTPHRSSEKCASFLCLAQNSWMYRKMKAEEASDSTIMNNTMPHLECVDKVTKLPVVEMLVNQTSDIYGKVKGSSGVANWTLSTAEATVNKVVEQAVPMAKRLEQPIHVVDQTLCRGLASLEDKVPMVKDDPQEIYAHAKGYVSSSLQPTVDRVHAMTNYGMETASSIKDYGWNKANDVLATKWGTVALSGFDVTVNLAEKYLDYYLPGNLDETAPADAVAVTEDPEDKVGATLHTVGRLSNKMRSRVYQAVVAQAHSLKRQSEESISSLGNVLELIPSNVRLETEALSAKVNALWTELSTEEDKEAGSSNSQRAIIVARKLTRNVATFCAQVPSHLSILMPAPLIQHMEQAANYATQLYDNLLKSGVQNLSESVQNNMKEQATRVQAALHELNLYTMQLMDTFAAKNMALAEKKEDEEKKE